MNVKIRGSELAPRLRVHLSHPPPRPLVLYGRSGAGTTTALRRARPESGLQVTWLSAGELIAQMVEAIRAGRDEA